MSSPEGQRDFMVELFTALKKTPRVIGAVFIFPFMLFSATAGQVAVQDLLLASAPSVDKAAALEALDKLSQDKDVPPVYRDLAVLKKVLIEGAGAYTTTYIERDVRQVLGVVNLSLFRRFVLMCAARSGQLLNLSALASDCGISHATARNWLTVLEASYVVHLLQPHHQNFGKRLVKMPKLYFLDTGLLCHLLRIDNPATLATHAMRGAVFETWVVSETLKHRWNQGLEADIYFWRDNHGVEVDLLFEQGGRLHAVEVKSGTTFSPDWLRSFDLWKKYAGKLAADPVVVYGGRESFVAQDVHVMPWSQLGLVPHNR